MGKTTDNVILTNFPGRKGAGALIAYEMTKALVENGNKVAAIVSEGIDNPELWDKLDLIKLLKISTYTNNLNFIINTALFSTKKKSITKAFESININLIYTPMICPWTQMIGSVFPKAKNVVTIHDPIHHSGASILYRLWPQTSIQAADKLVLPSKIFVKHIMEKYNRDRSDICVIPLGRFNLYTNYHQTKPIVEYRKEKVNFLFFGRITKYKGLEVLAQAYKKAKSTNENITLTIAGQGDFSKYKKLYENLKDVTVLNRWFEDSEVGNLFIGANIITVLPYLDATQSGVIPVAIEYLSPIIASDTGGLSEQVDEGITGLLVKPGDSDALSVAMLKLAADNDLQKKLAEQAKQKQNENTWTNLAKQLLDFARDQ